MLGGSLAAGAGLVGAATIGCGDDDEEDKDGGGGVPAASPTARPDEVDTNATLRSGIKADVGNLDAQSLAGGSGVANYVTHFILPLAVDQKTFGPVPYAVDYKWVENNTKLQLTARPNVKFHNGETLDAEQLKFNFDRVLGRSDLSPKFQGLAATLFGANLGDVAVVDQRTVNISMKAPDVTIPFFLAASSGIWPVPKGALQELGDQGMAQKAVGAGPFKFVSRTPDTEIRSVRFDEFFYGRDQPLGPRLPHIANLVQKVIPEDGARVAALQAGEIDIANELSGDLGKSLDGKPGFKVYYQYDLTPNCLMFNTLLEQDPISGGKNPFKDVRVRKALNMAVDTDTISQKVLTGKELPSFGVARQSFGFPVDLETRRWKFDPKQAKALLAEAGYPNGFKTELHAGTGRFVNMETVILAVTGYLKDVGIEVSVKLQPFPAFTAAAVKKDLPGMIYFGAATGELSFGTLYHSKGPFAHSVDPALGLDTLIDQARAEFDDQKRAKLFGDIIAKFYDNAMWLFLHQHARVIATRDNIEWQPYARTGFIAEYWNVKVLKKA